MSDIREQFPPPTIKRWLKGHAIRTDALVDELRYWAIRFAGGDPTGERIDAGKDVVAPPARYEAAEVPLTYCWRWGLVVETDLAADGGTIDHHDDENPCSGPHGIMWAAR